MLKVPGLETVFNSVFFLLGVFKSRVLMGFCKGPWIEFQVPMTSIEEEKLPLYFQLTSQ